MLFINNSTNNYDMTCIYLSSLHHLYVISLSFLYHLSIIYISSLYHFSIIYISSYIISFRQWYFCQCWEDFDYVRQGTLPTTYLLHICCMYCIYCMILLDHSYMICSTIRVTLYLVNCYRLWAVYLVSMEGIYV